MYKPYFKVFLCKNSRPDIWLRDSYGLAGLMKGTHTFPRGWAIPTYEMVAWQFF